LSTFSPKKQFFSEIASPDAMTIKIKIEQGKDIKIG
jgi:hypothetical protein